MSTPEFGVTPEGFKVKRLIDCKNQLEELFINEFGDVNLDAQSVIGQIIGIFSKVFADIWENDLDVYLSQYPNSASGISLDNVVALNGIVRLQAEQTKVVGVVTGNENTFIPSNSLAKIPLSGEIFYSVEDGFINSSESVKNIVKVTNLSNQTYTIIIDHKSYSYDLPTMNFSSPFVVGNTINIRLNNVNLPTVNFTTNSPTTFNLLRDSLLTSPDVASAIVVGNTIELTPQIGSFIIINAVQILGGGATYSKSLRTPSDIDTVASYLASRVATNEKSTAFANNENITITAINSENPYSISAGANLQITSVSSPIVFLAQNFGAIPAPANSLTQIMTPIAGWQSITNFEAGITGREIETDAELRLRRLQSLKVSGNATVEAIRARLLQEVSGVTNVTIFENVTLTTSPIEILFSIDFVAGNNIEVKAESLTIGVIPFTIDQISTMNLIANLIETRNEVLSADIVGVNNREILVTFKELESLTLEFIISGGATQPTTTISGGRPPKSFEAVVSGGSNQDVALKIWQTKPAGIETFGNTHVIIQDSQGTDQEINFSRAVPVYIYVLLNITLNPQEIFPVNGIESIKESILTYGNNLSVGLDVIKQKIESLAFLTQGVASATAQLAKVYSLSDTPIYISSDIDISSVESAVFDASRIEVNI